MGMMKNENYLSLLGATKSKTKRDLLIDYASNQDIKAIAEIIYNLLQGSIPLTSYQKRTLTKYQSTLRAIAKKSATKKSKKAILKQNGGFLPILLPLAISVLKNIL